MDRGTEARLRERAEYWYMRAERENDPKKQSEYREIALLHEQEADMLRDHAMKPIADKASEK